MIEWLTMFLQWLILAAVGVNVWKMRQVNRYSLETVKRIVQYRADIAWLTARIDELEKKVGKND